MLKAVEAVKNKTMGYQKASIEFHVPRTTLRGYVLNADKNPEELVNVKLGRRKTLSEEMETELVAYCSEMDELFYGLTSADLRRIAFQFALRKKVAHPFSNEKGTAGRKWLGRFLYRHPHLTNMCSQGISSVRVKGLSQENVCKFFNSLEPVLQKINSNPARIYNVDVTGITNTSSRIILLKEKRQLGLISPSEKDSLVTMVTCMNAEGRFMPPMLVFSKRTMKREMLEGMPPGTIAGYHPSGLMQQHLFTHWFRHFIHHTKPSAAEPIVLVLDGQHSYIRNLDIIDLARSHNVILISLPPNTTNKMQPIELAFMELFKISYSQEIEVWLKNQDGKVGAYPIGELLGKAYLKAATAEVSTQGFRKCGIFPCNRYIFDNGEFTIRESPSSSIQMENETSSTKYAHLGHHRGLYRSISDEDSTESAKLISSCPKDENLGKNMAKFYVKKAARKKVPSECEPGTSKTKEPKICEEMEYKREFDIKIEVDDTSDTDYNFVKIDNEDMECIFCSRFSSEDVKEEKWIRCSQCFKWAHELCSNFDRNKQFVCDFCLT